MPSPLVDIATGITISFPDSSFTAEILDVGMSGLSRGSVDVTHQGTTQARRFTPTDLYDAGEATFGFHFNPDTSPPIDQAPEVVTLTFPSGAHWDFTAFFTDYSGDFPLEDKMAGEATLKVDGIISITPAA